MVTINITSSYGDSDGLVTRDAWLRPHYHADHISPTHDPSATGARDPLAWAIVHEGAFRVGSNGANGMEVAWVMAREADELEFNESFRGLYARGQPITNGHENNRSECAATSTLFWTVSHVGPSVPPCPFPCAHRPRFAVRCSALPFYLVAMAAAC